jgi:rRNA pseudouridine-1189 N-methylase Emg1 (Nep1/Mra1 family)
MSNTPETEVLRISGNVTVPKRANNLAHLFEKFLKDWGYTWSGSIVPQDDDTGMRLYRVEEVEAKDEKIAALWKSIETYQEKEKREHQAFLDMTKSYEFERQERNRIDDILRDESWKLREAEKRILEKDLIIQSLRNKETRWRTFIKWWKELWKRISKKK